MTLLTLTAGIALGMCLLPLLRRALAWADAWLERIVPDGR